MANLSRITCTYEVRLLPQATISWLQIWVFFWGVTLPGLSREVRMLPDILDMTFHAEIIQEQFNAPVIWMLTGVSSCLRNTLLSVMHSKVATYLLWFLSLHLGLLFYCSHISSVCSIIYVSHSHLHLAWYSHVSSPLTSHFPWFPYLHTSSFFLLTSTFTIPTKQAEKGQQLPSVPCSI